MRCRAALSFSDIDRVEICQPIAAFREIIDLDDFASSQFNISFKGRETIRRIPERDQRIVRVIGIGADLIGIVGIKNHTVPSVLQRVIMAADDLTGLTQCARAQGKHAQAKQRAKQNGNQFSYCPFHI